MKSLQILFLFILLLAVCIRLLLSFLFAPHLASGQYIHFDTVLLSEPTSHGNFDTITVSYSNRFSSVPISLAIPAGNGLHYGDTVVISGHVKFKKINVPSNQNGQVLNTTRILTTLSAVHITKNTSKKNPILDISYNLRKNIQLLYETTFSPRLSALLLGIVLGVKGNFPKFFLQDLQATGVMHVIAASGMNVTMVGGFFLGLFGMVVKRQWAIALTGGCLLFYCVISGLQASILRATIMLLFALGGQLVGRQYSGLYGLTLAASGMLLYNPAWISDIGFQLSFAATMGIFFLKPLFPTWKIITDDIGTTIAAQIATLPILVGSFGSYGILSVLVNALVLWTVPPLMVFGGIGGLTGLVFETPGRLILLLCWPFLFFFEKIIVFFGNFHWQITLSEVPLVMTVGYYLLLVSWVWIRKKRTSVSLDN